MITAEIIKDSLNTHSGNRITTFILTYPRFIHSELMTHRTFSRNAASSRAIPVEKMMDAIWDNPAVPVEWGTTQKGMQAGPPLAPELETLAKELWWDGLANTMGIVKELLRLGLHKQIANRLLEPWAHMTTLVTATEYGNFFRLRAHPDAQPEFQELAFTMLDLYLQHEPIRMEPGEYHIPFDPGEEVDLRSRLAVATARAARISYTTHDGDHSVESDVKLHDRLLASGHMSPFEHAAQAHSSPFARQWANFRGWVPYRSMVDDPRKHDRISRGELEQIYSRRPER
jgi:thymidylate synthase ThyX